MNYRPCSRNLWNVRQCDSIEEQPQDHNMHVNRLDLETLGDVDRLRPKISPGQLHAWLQLTGAGAAGLDVDGTRLGDGEGGVHVHLAGAPFNERIAQTRGARGSHDAAAGGRRRHRRIRRRVGARVLQVV